MRYMAEANTPQRLSKILLYIYINILQLTGLHVHIKLVPSLSSCIKSAEESLVLSYMLNSKAKNVRITCHWTIWLKI